MKTKTPLNDAAFADAARIQGDRDMWAVLGFLTWHHPTRVRDYEMVGKVCPQARFDSALKGLLENRKIGFDGMNYFVQEKP